MKSMPAEHDPHTSPWDPVGARQTTQTGGSTRSAATRSMARNPEAPTICVAVVPMSGIIAPMPRIIECPFQAGEFQ